jgi:hypothetical protein
MARKPYSPVAPYTELKRVEGRINQAQSVAELRKVVTAEGPKVGYKAFCYMLGGKMTPEGMRPDEACVAAVTLEQQGKPDEAHELYKKVLAVYPDHPLAKGKVAG